MNISAFSIRSLSILLSVLLFMQLYACKRTTLKSNNSSDPELPLIEVNYAKGFDIEDHGEYLIMHVYNPWQNLKGINITYLLYPKGSSLPHSVRYDVAIPVPVSRVICTSTTHIAMIGALEEMETIVGISGKQYFYDSFIRSGIENGKIPDIGYEQSINYEMILSLKPDVIFLYGVTGEVSAIISRLTSLGIPVVLNAEYLENHPLARTEWIKFMACFYAEPDKGISFFRQQENAYLGLKSSIGEIKNKPSVMTGLPWNNTWWIPGGRSHLAVLIKDAGGRYIWEDDSSGEALPLDIESVYDKAGEADFWINSGSAVSLSDLVKSDPRLGLFKPFKDASVYNNNARINISGGNDYWESGIIYPHIILKDLVSIFHPEILPDHSLVYYQKLK